MFDIRRMLELSYMRQAFYALDDDGMREIRDCTTRLRECAQPLQDDEGAALAFTRIDRDFHMALFRPLGNSVLNSLLEAIWAVDEGFELERKSPHLVSSVPRHEAIADALEAYDDRAFARAMEAHFSSGKYSKHDSYEEF